MRASEASHECEAEEALYRLDPNAIQDPPVGFWASLQKVGPGFILAGSIVGTGELIQTTSVGAKAAYSLLWLVVFSCFIKVFVQVELGRYAIATGKTTLESFRTIPVVGHLCVWWWFFMMLVTLAQLGAMVDGVAQSCRLGAPGLSQQFGEWVRAAGIRGNNVEASETFLWAIAVTVLTIALLVSGSYGVVQNVTIGLVVGFTFTTLACVAVLPWTPYGFSWQELKEGLALNIPPGVFRDAMAMFGITGVGASELLAYPYWCIEKGYARWTGRRDWNHGWASRARGWLRLMRADAFGSMLVYTLATVGFYLMGAAVLYPATRGQGLAEGPQLIRTLVRMYEPVLGTFWATAVLLAGAFAVLFSTLFVASAGHARMLADFCCVLGLYRRQDDQLRRRLIQGLCVLYPTVAFLLYAFVGQPVAMVRAGGLAQAVTLPMIALATLYFRLLRTDPELKPTRLWDVFLVLSAVALIAVGVSTAYNEAARLFQLWAS